MPYDHNTHSATTFDPLVDRDCAVLDGKCNCKSVEGKYVPPDCKYLKLSDNIKRVTKSR